MFQTKKSSILRFLYGRHEFIDITTLLKKFKIDSFSAHELVESLVVDGFIETKNTHEFLGSYLRGVLITLDKVIVKARITTKGELYYFGKIKYAVTLSVNIAGIIIVPLVIHFWNCPPCPSLGNPKETKGSLLTPKQSQPSHTAKKIQYQSTHKDSLGIKKKRQLQ